MNSCSNVEQLAKILQDRIIPCIAGYALMKLMKRTLIKYHLCTNKLIYGHGYTLSYKSKN